MPSGHNPQDIENICKSDQEAPKVPRVWAVFINLPVSLGGWIEIVKQLRELGLSIEEVCTSSGYRMDGVPVPNSYIFTIPETEIDKANEIFLRYTLDSKGTSTSLSNYLEKSLRKTENAERSHGESTNDRQRIAKITELLKQAFGKHTRGDATEKAVVLDVDYMYGSTSGLAGIVTRAFFGMTREFAIGNFLNQQGDKLEVTPSYKHSARKYAELYHKQFGKEVEITTI